jgi:hypothetical protein
MSTHVLSRMPLDVPNPKPVQPPGMGAFTTILDWISWGVLMIAVAGFLVSLGMIVLGAIQGRDQHGMKGLFVSLIVCIALGAVGAIMRTFT